MLYLVFIIHNRYFCCIWIRMGLEYRSAIDYSSIWCRLSEKNISKWQDFTDWAKSVITHTIHTSLPPSDTSNMRVSSTIGDSVRQSEQILHHKMTFTASLIDKAFTKTWERFHTTKKYQRLALQIHSMPSYQGIWFWKIPFQWTAVGSSPRLLITFILSTLGLNM